MELSNLKINYNKINDVTFEMKIDGLSNVNDALVRFCINCREYLLCCSATSATSGTYTVTIPIIPELVVGDYDCAIEVIIQGHYFNPWSGKIAVVEEVKVTTITTPTTGEIATSPQVQVSNIASTSDEVIGNPTTSSELPPALADIPFIFADSTREFTTLVPVEKHVEVAGPAEVPGENPIDVVKPTEVPVLKKKPRFKWAKPQPITNDATNPTESLADRERRADKVIRDHHKEQLVKKILQGG